MGSFNFMPSTWNAGRRTLATGVAAVALMLPGSPMVFGQEIGPEGFKNLTPSPALTKSKSKEKEIEGIVRSVLKGDVALEANQAIFDDYYSKFFFPRMTLTSEDALSKLADARQKFLRDLSDVAKNPTAHEHLLDITLSNLAPIVQDAAYHPAVRYNCLMILGSLNAVEAVRVGTSKAPPEPFTKALPTLLEEFKKPGNLDAIRVAALLGITRHLEWDDVRPAASRMPQPMRQDCIAQLLALATMVTPPGTTTPDGHLWMRRRAIEALALSSTVIVDPTIKDAFEKLLADEQQPLPIRVAVAAGMGKMAYKAPALPKVDAQTKELGYVAALACRVGVQRLTDMRKHEEELTTAQGAAGAAAAFGGESGGAGGPPGAGRIPGGASGMPGGMPGMPKLGGASGSGMPTMPGMGGKKGGGSGYGLGMPGGFPGMGGSGAKAEEPLEPHAYRYDYLKRQLRAQLFAVQQGLGDPKAGAGLKGMKSAATVPADVKYVEDVTKKLGDIIKVIESKDPRTPEEFRKDLSQAVAAIETVTRKVVLVAPEEPAVPAAGEVAPAAAAPAPAPGAVAAPAAPAAEAPAAEPAAAPAAAPPAEPAAEAPEAPAAEAKAE